MTSITCATATGADGATVCFAGATISGTAFAVVFAVFATLGADFATFATFATFAAGVAFATFAAGTAFATFAVAAFFAAAGLAAADFAFGEVGFAAFAATFVDAFLVAVFLTAAFFVTVFFAAIGETNWGMARFDCVGLVLWRTERLPGAVRGGSQPRCALRCADGVNAGTCESAAASFLRRARSQHVDLRRGGGPRHA